MKSTSARSPASRTRQLHVGSIGVALALSLCVSLTSLAGSETGSRSPDYSKFGSEWIGNISGNPLPFTGSDSDLRIDFSPKLSDVVHENYIRLPIEATYSFTDKREGTLGYTPYLETPFKSGAENSDSKGVVTFGFKQRLEDVGSSRTSLAAGLFAKIPLEEVPVANPRASFDEYTPFITVAHRIGDRGRWLSFSTLRYHSVGKDRRQEVDPSQVFRKPNSLGVVQMGLIYQPRGPYRYGLAFEYKTDRFDGGNDDGLKVIPSVTWFTDERTPFIRSIAGFFEFSLELDYVFSEIREEEGGSDLGVSLKTRWRLYKKRPRPENEVL